MSNDSTAWKQPDRAAQFIPFAALTGFYDLVHDAEQPIEDKREPSEQRAEHISRELARLKPRQLIRTTYYNGRSYSSCEGVVTRINIAERTFDVIKTRISFDDVWELRHIND